ncbi:MAG: hypothetical protein Fues2KO_45740 [Fuerstiella sp.]
MLQLVGRPQQPVFALFVRAALVVPEGSLCGSDRSTYVAFRSGRHSGDRLVVFRVQDQSRLLNVTAIRPTIDPMQLFPERRFGHKKEVWQLSVYASGIGRPQLKAEEDGNRTHQ